MYGIVPEYSMEMMHLHDNKNFFIVIIVIVIVIVTGPLCGDFTAHR